MLGCFLGDKRALLSLVTMLSFNSSEDKWLVCLDSLLPLVNNVFLSRGRREMIRYVLSPTSTQDEKLKSLLILAFWKKFQPAHPKNV